MGELKIITIGRVIDNNDPKNIGRIRVSTYSDFNSVKENFQTTWNEWDRNDPFMFIPLLPTHINIVPEINQSVMIIRFDPTQESHNQLYIPGPYTTSFDFNHQTFSQQTTNTSFGIVSKEKPNIKNITKTNYDFVKKESIGSLPKISDISLNGKYGSNVVLTDSGFMLWAGRLVSKETATKEQIKVLSDYPIKSKKSGGLYLKKFSKTYSLQQQERKQKTENISIINTLIEYDVDSLTNPSKVTISTFKNIDNSITTKSIDINSSFPMVNKDNLDVVLSTNDRITEAYVEIRNTINDLLSNETIYPVYFRPKLSLRKLKNSNKDIIFNNVIVNDIKTNGLIYSLENNDVINDETTIIEDVLVEDSNNDNVLGALITDEFYMLSQSSTNPRVNSIDFDSLDNYELTQDDYLKKIKPKTYSMVRGENLIDLLRLIVSILLDHNHNIGIEGTLCDLTTKNKLNELMRIINDDLINKNLRIN